MDLSSSMPLKFAFTEFQPIQEALQMKKTAAKTIIVYPHFEHFEDL